MRALEFIRDHVLFKLLYDFSYHMKTPFTRIILGFSEFNVHSLLFAYYIDETEFNLSKVSYDKITPHFGYPKLR